MRSATSFDLKTPDMKSAGLGTYCSRTIFAKISGLVLSTQSASFGLPGRTSQRAASTRTVHFASSSFPSDT